LEIVVESQDVSKLWKIHVIVLGQKTQKKTFRISEVASSIPQNQPEFNSLSRKLVKRAKSALSVKVS
jgi:hypothetical protein